MDSEQKFGAISIVKGYADRHRSAAEEIGHRIYLAIESVSSPRMVFAWNAIVLVPHSALALTR
jgi:hypothetical protein